jgi:hypothetical protein
MPKPSTPEAHNLHCEAQSLIEQVSVQQAESSGSHMRHQSSTRNDASAQDQEAFVHIGGATRQPANQGRMPVRERIHDTSGQPRMATPTTS